MKTLHILKSEPDTTIQELIYGISGSDPEIIRLYTGEVSWDQVVQRILEHDKVVCWW